MGVRRGVCGWECRVCGGVRVEGSVGVCRVRVVRGVCVLSYLWHQTTKPND